MHLVISAHSKQQLEVWEEVQAAAKGTFLAQNPRIPYSSTWSHCHPGLAHFYRELRVSYLVSAGNRHVFLGQRQSREAEQAAKADLTTARMHLFIHTPNKSVFIEHLSVCWVIAEDSDTPRTRQTQPLTLMRNLGKPSQ